jgi:hypothetical protein
MYVKQSISIMALLAAVVFLGFFLMFAGRADAEDVKLPEPQTTGGAGMFDMLKNRASALSGSFPAGAVSMEELSTLLWAASGLNRPEKGWTVPMAMGREPYCKVYAAGEQGVFLYDWKDNVLREITKGDVRGELGSQGFIANVPYILIFVTDGEALESFGARGAGWGYVAVGAMTQNVYLAAEALSIGVRYMASMNPDAVRGHLKLADSDTPVCIMPVGKK